MVNESSTHVVGTRISPAIAVPAAFVILIALIIGAARLAGSGHPLSLLATLICLVVAVPILLTKDKDLFSPWTYMFYFVVLNILIRSLFVDFHVTGGVTDLDEVFFRGQPDRFMVGSALIMLVGFAFLTIGYLWAPTKAAPLRYRVFQSDSYDQRRLRTVLTLMLLVAVLAFVIFIRLTFTGIGDFALAMLSQNRGLSQELDEYRAYGYLRLLIGLSVLVAYLAYAQQCRLRGGKGYYRLLLGVAVIVSAAMDFYSQSRAALVLLFLNFVFLKYYFSRHRFPWKPFVLFVPVVVGLFFVTSYFRRGAGVDISGGVTPMTIVAPIVLNIGGIDISKTGHVIDYTTDAQDYKFGETLVQFALAIVPRQLWPDKPVNLDTYIGAKIYGADTFGAAAVPPGFFAEMYMNFWYAGIFIGAILLGALMKRIRNLLASNQRNVNFLLVYVVVLQSIGMSIMGSGFSSTVMGSLMTGVPLLIVLRYVTVSARSSRAPRAAGGSIARQGGAADA